MRTKLYMITLAAMTMILALSACSESEDLLSAFHSDPNAVRITAQVGKASADGFTRSNPLGDADAQTKFNKNDEISVKADDQEAVTYQYDGSEWLPKESGKFLKWENKTMTFTAYYPATFNGTITQPTEYTSLKSLAAADFMSFTGEQSNTNGNNLTLTMKRQMARVVVEVVGFNDQYDKKTPINSVTICGVTAYKHMDDGKFYALIKPCEAQTANEFLSLEVGESNAKETLTGIPALEAGKSYTYELTVGKNKISVSGITVKDWTTGDITGGKAIYAPYVTFKANREQKFYMYVDAEKEGKNYTFPNLEYSVNNGKWTPVVANEKVTFGGANGDLRLRGTNNINGTSSRKAMDTDIDNMDHSSIIFSTKEKVACEGDIRTLLDYKTYKTVNTNEACFYKLFEDCEQLTSAPDLPATNLANSCYKNMFSGCSSLSKAPDLPATTLAPGCYLGMFSGCSSLSKAPDLSATTLAKGCYAHMFDNCISLSKVPDLPATTLAQTCYFRMFKNCKKISAVTMLAPKTQITNNDLRFHEWLVNAGTEASEPLTLKVQDADAYNALESYLPENWKIGTATVKDGNNKEINIE